ncbi:MAG: hypothetical protein DYG98_20660 [Haliscomenobacteraceae bacterium CHB4]|nr:hypothetical protein [Saprospiraceae bacterium]MCE7925474.1 hypothetical protein [Haliscomenobacteraceae bacterium CHB4]
MGQKCLINHITVNSGNFLKKAFFLLAICCISCGRDNEKIINEKVKERVTAFREKKNTECREVLLAEAEKIVDSLLLSEARLELSDSLVRMRPARPARPAPLAPIDSLPVRPIFDPASPTGNR